MRDLVGLRDAMMRLVAQRSGLQTFSCAYDTNNGAIVVRLVERRSGLLTFRCAYDTNNNVMVRLVSQQSGLLTFRCAYNTDNDRPFLIITFFTWWSNITVRYARRRACKMMM